MSLPVPRYCAAVRELAKLAMLAGVPMDVILKGALVGALDAIDPEQRILAAEVKLTTRGTVKEVKGELVINVSTLDRVVAGAEEKPVRSPR